MYRELLILSDVIGMKDIKFKVLQTPIQATLERRLFENQEELRRKIWRKEDEEREIE
jgi:hypothetical protein